MANRMLTPDLTEVARREGAFARPVRHSDVTSPQAKSYFTPVSIATPQVVLIEAPTGSGKAAMLVDSIRRLAGANRQAATVAPTVIETVAVALRLQTLVTTPVFSQGVGPGGERAREWLVLSHLVDGQLHRPIRRLLIRLDVHVGLPAALLTVVARRLLDGAYTCLNRAASICRHARPDVPTGVPVPTRPQLTRGPTALWTNNVLSVLGEPIHA